MKTKPVKRCREDVIFDTVIFILLTLILFVVAYPLYWVIISSFSDPTAVSAGKVLLRPIGFTLKGYAEVFKNSQVMRGFFNSIVITFVGVCVNLAVTLPTAYALSRDNFSGKKPITIFYMITMFFGGGMIPTYLVVKNMQLLNTIWALVLPGCLSVYNMIVARTFFKSNISEELYEARVRSMAVRSPDSSSRSHCRCPKRSSRSWSSIMELATGTAISQLCFIFPIRISTPYSWY